MEKPFHRVLVPLDGSRLAESLLSFVFMLARRCGASVTLVHVMEHEPPASIHGEAHLSDQVEAEDYLRRLGERLASTGVHWDIHVHRNPERDVARGIAAHADELQADLIALTTHGSGGIRGFLFGRTAQQVLRHTPTTVPVLLSHPIGEPSQTPALRTILVPLNWEVDPSLMLSFAGRLAGCTGGQLRLFRVVPTRGTLPGGHGAATFAPAATSALLDLEAEAARDALRETRQQLPREVPVSLAVGRGDVAGEILREASEAGADLLLATTHAKAGLEGFLSGSVGATLLERFHHPLVLFRVD